MKIDSFERVLKKMHSRFTSEEQAVVELLKKEITKTKAVQSRRFYKSYSTPIRNSAYMPLFRGKITIF